MYFPKGGETEITAVTDIGRAVLHNLQFRSRTAEWIDLETALKGPAYVAKVLIKKLQDDRSKPGKRYKVNAEQLECTALLVAVMRGSLQLLATLGSAAALAPARTSRRSTIVMGGAGAVRRNPRMDKQRLRHLPQILC